jgi:hypothetical protein
MNRDIDIIIESVQAKHPEIAVSQLKVTHAADDDGIWFFKSKASKFEVQLESSKGTCPFLIETDESAERYNGGTPAEAETILLKLLHVRE